MLFYSVEVQFCGYTVPHPAENKMHFRIQTDNDVSAVETLKKGLADLDDMCEYTIELFESEVHGFLRK
jgi:DNA-directed RNA polymerases I and III subunit RPAC2